jgi:hypothetical protein
MPSCTTSAPPRDVVHHAADRLLVAGNLASGEDDDVLAVQLDVAVVVDRDAGKRRLRLTLRAGADAHDVLGRVVANVAVADLDAGWNPEVAEPFGDLRVLVDASTHEGEFAVELVREIEHYLHAVDARRERGHDDSSLRAGEDLFEGVDDVALRAADALSLDIRAVGEQDTDACRPKLRKPVEVDVFAVERRLVDLEVAGMDHDPGRRRDCQRDAVGHAVRHADEFDGELPDANALARVHRDEAVARVLPVFLQFRLDQRQRQRRAVDGAVDVAEHVRHGADVVFVPVREDERLQPVLLQQAQVRDDQIDAKQLRVREHDSRVDEDRGVAAGDNHHVHPELAESAERNQIERRHTGRAGRIRTVCQCESQSEDDSAAAGTGRGGRRKASVSCLLHRWDGRAGRRWHYSKGAKDTQRKRVSTLDSRANSSRLNVSGRRPPSMPASDSTSAGVRPAASAA